jgi:peroxin-3
MPSSEQHQSQHSRRRRQRSKIGTTGRTVVTAALVAYGTYRIGKWAWDQIQDWNESLNNQESSTPEQRRFYHRLRRERLSKCHDEVLHTLEGFFSTIRRFMESETDCTLQQETLKQQRRNRQKTSYENAQKEQESDLWAAIQIETMTRLIATAYAHTILYILLTVQIHLIGGYLFRKAAQEQQQQQRDPSSMSFPSTILHQISDQFRNQKNLSINPEVYRSLFLQTSHIFLDQGLPDLVNMVRNAVQRAMTRDVWNISNPDTALHMTHDKFQDTIVTIRNDLECNELNRILQKIVIEPMLIPNHNDDVKALMEETCDVMESPVVRDALLESLNVTFDIMKHEHWSLIFGGEDRPVAQVIAQVKHTTNSFYRQGVVATENLYCVNMASLTSVKELADVCFN